MSNPLRVIGAAVAVGAACAACCAVPLALPLLAGLGLGSGASLAAFGSEVGLGLVIAAGALSAILLRRRASATPACRTDSPCGCGPKALATRSD